MSTVPASQDKFWFCSAGHTASGQSDRQVQLGIPSIAPAAACCAHLVIELNHLIYVINKNCQLKRKIISDWKAKPKHLQSSHNSITLLSLVVVAMAKTSHHTTYAPIAPGTNAPPPRTIALLALYHIHS